MDIIVIGKKSFKRSEPPQVVYCGQSRDEAMEAVYAAAKAGELVWFYFINPEPRTPITLPGPEQVAELEAIAARKRAKEQARLDAELKTADERAKGQKEADKRTAEAEAFAKEQAAKREAEAREFAKANPLGPVQDRTEVVSPNDLAASEDPADVAPEAEPVVDQSSPPSEEPVAAKEPTEAQPEPEPEKAAQQSRTPRRKRS
jgi:hypothetical protein